jgi:hypothetical protein
MAAEGEAITVEARRPPAPKKLKVDPRRAVGDLRITMRRKPRDLFQKKI